jgi:hypothetical protein
MHSKTEKRIAIDTKQQKQRRRLLSPLKAPAFCLAAHLQPLPPSLHKLLQFSLSLRPTSSLPQPDCGKKPKIFNYRRPPL